MWEKGGADKENPMPYLKITIFRVISIAAVVRSEKGNGEVALSLTALPHGAANPEHTSEVRKLAHRSSKASTEIGVLVQTSLESINSGRNLVKDGELGMDEIRTKIETMLNKLKSESDSNLTGILHSVKEITEVMENIKVASQEQATGVERINRTIADMDTSTQENLKLVEQNESASQDITQEAKQLQSLLKAFKVDHIQQNLVGMDPPKEMKQEILKFSKEKVGEYQEKT